jgi:hypothetical protein
LLNTFPCAQSFITRPFFELAKIDGQWLIAQKLWRKTIMGKPQQTMENVPSGFPLNSEG